MSNKASGPPALESGSPARDNRGFKKLALATEAGKAGDYAKALQILEELVSRSYAPPEAWLLLGRTFHTLKEYSRALAAFDDYLKLRPRSSQGYLFMGRTYLAVSMPYKAAPFLRKAHGLHPRNTQITALLATAYLRSRHSGEAVDLFGEAVEEAAKTGTAEEYSRVYRAYLNALLVRGVRLCRNEEYDLGRQMLAFVLENGGADADGPFLRLELGRACRETERLEEALGHYSAALEFAPDDRRIRWSRVSILMALGRHSEAREDIARIRAKEPGVPELPWNSGLVDVFMIRSFLEAGEWRAAGDLCRNFLKNQGRDFRGNAVIHALYAEALRNQRNFRAAHFHLEKAEEEEPGELQFWYADILVSWEGKDWKALKKALRMAKSLGGDADSIRRFEALLEAYTLTDDRKILSLLQNAVRGLGPEPELMFALGGAYLRLGLPELAKSWYQKTLVLKENHEEARLGEIAAQEAILAQGITGGEDGEDAAGELDNLYRVYLEKWPDNFSIRRERALFLIRIFEYREAAEELEKLLLREPSNQSLRRVLAYSYRKTGRYREAAVFLKALLREKPCDLALLLEYSGCLERAGGIKYALAILEKAREIFVNSSDVSLALGILNFRTNRIEAAFDFLREAAAFDKTDPRPYEWMAVMARKNGNAEQTRYYEREAQKRKNPAKSSGLPVAESFKKR